MMNERNLEMVELGDNELNQVIGGMDHRTKGKVFLGTAGAILGIRFKIINNCKNYKNLLKL